MMQPVVIRAHQHQIAQFGGPAVLPMPNVMGMQTPGGPAPGHHTAPVAVLQRPAQPPADLPGLAARADHLTVALQPHLTRRIAEQEPAFGVGEQRTQMQRRGPVLDVEVHHHGGALPVRAARHVAVPPGLDQTQEPIDAARPRRHPNAHARAGTGTHTVTVTVTRTRTVTGALAVVALPLRDERIVVGLQRGIEGRGLGVRQGDLEGGGLLTHGRADRTRRLGPRTGIGFGLGLGSRFQLDRGAQLVDRGDLGELGVVLIGALGGPRGDDAHLIQGEPALPHPGRTARELVDPVRHGGDGGGVGR